MSIAVKCPSCGKHLKAPDSVAGKRAKCPRCGKPVEVPASVPEDDFASALSTADEDEFGADDDFFDRRPAPKSKRGQKTCPSCAEKVSASDVRCPFCREPLGRTSAARRDLDREAIGKFRREMQALGALWIVIGALTLLAGLALAIVGDALEAILVLGVAAIWIAAGVCTCTKQLWAVYTGLVLSYLGVAGNLFRLPGIDGRRMGGFICGLIFLIIAIVTAHRCIRAAKQLDRAGVPLTARP